MKRKRRTHKGQVEVNRLVVTDPGDLGAGVFVTPPIGADYWLARVKVSQRQAVQCFPKFSTIGIGFARERDWNTNLPWTCAVEEIFEHIKHNKGRAATDEACRSAIRALQAWIKHNRRGGEKVKYLSIDRCPSHGYWAVSVDEEDGGGIRLTPGKCCGRWQSLKRWRLDSDLIEHIREEIASAEEEVADAE